jgi:FixJ family two-component response regulator
MNAPSPFVCVIDDDPPTCESLDGLLRSAGLRTATFASARDHLRAELLAQTDCLIVDVHMPEMSGLELRQELRARHANVPTIVISGKIDESIRAEVERSGACCYIAKPFDDEVLLREVHAARRTRRSEP